MSKIHVKILEQARLNIESGRSGYICNAIIWQHVHPKQTKQLVEYIGNALEGHETLMTWLRETNQGDHIDSNSQLKETRLAWIDWMINEWKDVK